VFTPEKVQPDTYVPPVAITSFDVLGESRPIPDRVSLSYRDRWFSMSFASLSFATPARNHYRYRLVGFHDWVETDRRFVSYSSLPPGNYTLEIEGSTAHGVWSKAGVHLPIHVPPPPWRTWWAFSLYLLIVLLIAALFVRRHRSQLEALRRTHRLSELEREVALSSAVQEGFFPPQRSVHDGVFRLEAFYRAAAQCGGDWWSYEARHDSYFVVVGDATGHGIGSAMVTAAAASTFRSLGPTVDDETRLAAMNAEVLRVSRGQYHMTLTAVELNLVTGQYIIRSAGGVPVFALAPNARPRVLMCPGTPLGSEDFETGQLTGQLVPGERLLILTDGLPEVALANSQILGPRGVANFYVQTRELELETALQQLVGKVEEVNSSIQDDDWTVVIVQWGMPLTIDRGDSVSRTGDRATMRVQ
jgi:serine phosphatase RsbU (regulator of sigma subunit)